MTGTGRTCSRKGDLSIRAATAASAASLSSRRDRKRGASQFPGRRPPWRTGLWRSRLARLGVPDLRGSASQDAKLVITGSTCRLPMPSVRPHLPSTSVRRPCFANICRCSCETPSTGHTISAVVCNQHTLLAVRHARTCRRSSGKDLGSLASCCLAAQEIYGVEQLTKIWCA